MKRLPDVFTAADVARFCAVDLKTVHHWAERGKLRVHATPGGHLRVQRADLAAFLRAYSMPVPRAMKDARPKLVAVDEDHATLAGTVRALARRFEVDAFGDAVDALVAIGREPPQVVVAATPLASLDVAHFAARLRAIDATAHVRVVAIARDEDEAARLENARIDALLLVREKTHARVLGALATLTGLA